MTSPSRTFVPACRPRARRLHGFLLCGAGLCAAGAAQPAVLFTDVEAGPVTGGPGNLGVPISIFGTGFGAVRGNSRVTIGGIEVAAYHVWGAGNASNPLLDMIVVQPGPRVSGGPIVVEVGLLPSNPDHRFTANSGRILYVATDGSDQNAGTESAPFATILHAVARARSGPGDTILVRGGTYGEGEIWIRENESAGGVLGQNKTIAAHPRERVVLDNPARGLILDAAYLTISGLHLRNGKTMGMYDSATGTDFKHGLRLVNNSVIGPIAWDAIGTHGDGHVIAGNLILVTSSTVGTQGHCIYVSVGSGLRITHNVVTGAPGYGIHLFDQCRSRTDYRRVIRDVIVEGNVLHGSRLRSGMIVAMGDECGHGNVIADVTIRNNVFVGNNHAGLVLRGISRDIQVLHNTFYQNGRQALSVSGDPTLQNVTVSANLFYQSPNNACS